MRIGNAAIIAAEEPNQRIGHEYPLPPGYTPHNPEIHGTQAPIFINEHVSGMHIRMEITIPENLQKENPR